MKGTFAGNAQGFLLAPVETFRQSKADTPGAVFVYLAALLLINAALSALVALGLGFRGMQAPGGTMDAISGPAGVFLLVLVGGCILTLAGAAWIHLWVYLCGGRRGILQTVTAIIYAGTPGHLLGWIPLIGFVAALWSLVLVVLGIRELQELSTGKTILAVAIAIIIPLALLVLAAAYFMIGSTVVTAVPVPG